MLLATLNKKNLFLYQWDVCKMYNICGLVLLTAQAGQGRWLPLPKSVLLKVFLLKKSSSFLPAVANYLLIGSLGVLSLF